MIQDLCHSSRDGLAALLKLEAQTVGDWLPSDYADILQHQLTVPILGELVDEDPALGRQLNPEGRAIRTLAELLGHTQPPLPLLELAKRFCKACLEGKGTVFPADLALALYYTVLAVGLVRTKARITRLTDAQFCTGIQWGLQQDWLPPLCRDRLQEALVILTPAPGPDPAPRG